MVETIPQNEKIAMWYYLGWSVYLIYFKLFLKRKVYGRENVPADGAFIFASNHASNFDPPLIGTSITRPVAYMARDTLFAKPIAKWALGKVNAFPVRREEGDTRAIRDALSVLESGMPLVLFPEGSRTEDGRLKSAKPGIGFIVAKANVPVVPVYIKGSFEAWPKGAKRVKFVPVSVHIGKPVIFDPGELEAKGRDAYQRVSDHIMERIAQIKAEDEDTIGKKDRFLFRGKARHRYGRSGAERKEPHIFARLDHT